MFIRKIQRCRYHISLRFARNLRINGADRSVWPSRRCWSPRSQRLVFWMALLRGLFWFALFIVFTFCFVVLFEYGPRDFANGVQKDYIRVKSFVAKQTEKLAKLKKNR